MAKFTVTVTEIYCKTFEIETTNAETAEAIVRGQWDQAKIDLVNGRGTFDHVEVDAEVGEGAGNVAHLNV